MVKQVGEYELGATLGSGSFATVRLGTNVETNAKVAVKIIDRQRIEEADMEVQLKREIALMKLLKHPNVVEMKEVMVSGKRIYIVMECVAGGEFMDAIKKAGGRGLDEDVARRYFQQLMAGLSYCHYQGVAHRDLKPQNMLLDEATDSIKIADFGLANVQDANSSALKTACGSPQYVAPEVLTEAGYNGHLADVWSCGVILYLMLCGKLPFDETSQNALFAKISAGEYRMARTIPEEAADLIKKMLVVDPKKRYTLKDVMTHPWFLVNAGKVAGADAATVGGKQITLTEDQIKGAVSTGVES